MASPSDFSELSAACRGGLLDPLAVVAVLGKTEGNGGRNDFSRELAVTAAANALALAADTTDDAVEEGVMLSFSGGTEGVVTPHYHAFYTAGFWPGRPLARGHLAVGRIRTRPFEPGEVGRMAMVDETARAVRHLLHALRILPEDAHFIHVKGAIPSEPFPRTERNCMAFSRAASALGVALALGEVAGGAVSDETMLSDYTLYSSRASTSAKPGLRYSDILVIGNSPWWEGTLVAGHTLMQDIIDGSSVGALLREMGAGAPGAGAVQPNRIRAIFAKAEADPRQNIRGYRHTMLSDDDIADTRYARCAVSAVLASVTGSPVVYVSTRAEHHGPLGGGPVALIVEEPKVTGGSTP
jgi:cyanuric acid amidohydrolase